MLISCVPTWYAYLRSELCGDMLRDMHEMAQMLNAKKNTRNQRYGVTLAAKLLRYGS